MARDKQWYVTDKGFEWLRSLGTSFTKKRSRKTVNLRILVRAVGSFAGGSAKSTLENVRNRAEQNMSESDAQSAWSEAQRRKFIQGI